MNLNHHHVCMDVSVFVYKISVWIHYRAVQECA